MDARHNPRGMTERSGHSRRLLSGIYLDGLQLDTRHKPAGMTEGGGWIPATTCGYDRRGETGISV